MLSDRYAARGLSILGFPCNQFGGQEPGTAAEIGEFCQKNYGVTFEMFEKVDVNGPDRHPLFALLLGDGSPFPGDIKWNFEKFLVDKGGGLVARYSSRIKPESQELQTKLEAALG
jgi:glutathione peroxidase